MDIFILVQALTLLVDLAIIDTLCVKIIIIIQNCKMLGINMEKKIFHLILLNYVILNLSLYKIEQKYLNKIKASNISYNLVFIVGGFPDSSGNKNPRWINVSKKQKNLIKHYWKKFHTTKTIVFIKTEFGYGGSVARRIIKEIKQELNIPNKTKDNIIYCFQNIMTNTTFKGTRQQFIKSHNMSYVTVSELILGKISKTRSGWIIGQSSKT